jgi:hypothetical protein
LKNKPSLEELKSNYQKELEKWNVIKNATLPFSNELQALFDRQLLELGSKMKSFELEPDIESEEITTTQPLENYIPFYNRTNFVDKKEEILLDEFNRVIHEDMTTTYKPIKQLLDLNIKTMNEVSKLSKETLAKTYIHSVPLVESIDSKKEEEELDSEFNKILESEIPKNQEIPEKKKRNQTYLNGEIKIKRRPFPFKKGEFK